MFFFGTFEHAIDERGRIAIPARFRAAFADGGVLRESPEGSVELYPMQTFNEEVERRLNAEVGNRTRTARRIRRGFLSGAFQVELDRQGRVLIPERLRESGALEGRSIVVGVGDYVEIWNPERWEQESERIDEELSEDEVEA